MTAKKEKGVTTAEKIVSSYMEYVLEQGAKPVSVYKFCKENKIEESEFYEVSGSFEGLEAYIWEYFYQETITLLEKNKEYHSYSSRDKLLAFLFSFFELLNLNRSYVLLALGNQIRDIENMRQLRQLRKHVKRFSEALVDRDNEDKATALSKRSPKLFGEASWWQFLFLLKFWMSDNSPGFEKTDMAIEKSVNTAFDVFDNTPLDRVIDFGKFLFKENLV